MNKLLKYGKGSTKIGFVDMGSNFYDASIPPKSEQIDYVNTIANNCRWWYEPVFANESKYLPTTQVMTDTTNVSVVDLTSPPQEAQSNPLVKALLVGGVAMILYNLFTD